MPEMQFGRHNNPLTLKGFFSMRKTHTGSLLFDQGKGQIQILLMYGPTLGLLSYNSWFGFKKLALESSEKAVKCAYRE